MSREWFVIRPTNCGRETFTGNISRAVLKGSLKTARIDRYG